MAKIRFVVHLPGGDRQHYITPADVEVVLHRLPRECWERLREVHFNDRGRARCLGYANRSSGQIGLCALPPHVSMNGALEHRLEWPREYGAERTRQWPRLAVRRFMLYDTFLHEVGHLQEVYPKSKNRRRVYALEPMAREFARFWRRRLWAEPFEHEDPVHNPPPPEEFVWPPPGSSAFEILAQVQQSRKDGRHGQALRWLTQHTAPEVSLWHRCVAEACYESGFYVQAAEHSARALELSPQELVNQHNQAAALIMLGKLDQARFLLEECLAQRESLRTRGWLVACLRRQGEKARAEVVMREPIETRPDCPQRWQWYADQLADLGRREEARQSRRRAQELRPTESTV